MSASNRSPDTCPYRQPLDVPEGKAHHSCGLAQSICGAKDPTLFPVRLDECALCCRTKEPLPSAPNGLVASTLYKALRRIRDAGGMEGCSASHAEALIPWTKSHFVVIFMGDLKAGARSRGTAYTGPCAHLGAQTGERLCKTCRGQVWLKVFDCHHPRHESTVIRECMTCADYTTAAPAPQLSNSHSQSRQEALKA